MEMPSISSTINKQSVGAEAEHSVTLLEQAMQNTIPFRISQLSAKLNAQSGRLLRKYSGLSLVQWRILFVLEGFKVASASELAQRTLMDAGLLSRNLRNLIDSGLVLSSQNPEDQRQSKLRLSAKGRRIYEKSAPYMEKRREFLLQGISDHDRQILFKVLDQLDANAMEQF